MAVTLAIFVAVQIFVPASIRPTLLTPTVSTVALNQSTMSQATGLETIGSDGSVSAADPVYVLGLAVPSGAWVESSSAVEDSAGKQIGSGLIQNCIDTGGGRGFRADRGLSRALRPARRHHL